MLLDPGWTTAALSAAALIIREGLVQRAAHKRDRRAERTEARSDYVDHSLEGLAQLTTELRAEREALRDELTQIRNELGAAAQELIDARAQLVDARAEIEQLRLQLAQAGFELALYRANYPLPGDDRPAPHPQHVIPAWKPPRVVPVQKPPREQI